MSRRRKRSTIVVRAKCSYPTRRRALRSLEIAGYESYALSRACHTGTYWRWELKP